MDIAVDFGISGRHVTRVLERAALFLGSPTYRQRCRVRQPSIHGLTSDYRTIVPDWLLKFTKDSFSASRLPVRCGQFRGPK